MQGLRTLLKGWTAARIWPCLHRGLNHQPCGSQSSHLNHYATGCILLRSSPSARVTAWSPWLQVYSQSTRNQRLMQGFLCPFRPFSADHTQTTGTFQDEKEYLPCYRIVSRAKGATGRLLAYGLMAQGQQRGGILRIEGNLLSERKTLFFQDGSELFDHCARLTGAMTRDGRSIPQRGVLTIS